MGDEQKCVWAGRAPCSASSRSPSGRLRGGAGDLPRARRRTRYSQFALPYRILMLAPAAVSLITVALWPAYTEAMARGDREWAERTLKRFWVRGLRDHAGLPFAVGVGPLAWDWLTGAVAAPTRGLLVVLGLFACVMSASTALGVFLTATGRLGSRSWRCGGCSDQPAPLDHVGGAVRRCRARMGDDHRAGGLRPRSRRRSSWAERSADETRGTPEASSSTRQSSLGC